MSKKFHIVVAVIICVLSSTLSARQVREELMQKPWKAQWITGPGAPLNRWMVRSDQTLKEYGVFKFRKRFTLPQKPSSFIVHVSADNRYKLYVNDNLVSQGPARGDLYFWNFETVDLAPYLAEGENTVAAVVWNDGPNKGEAQITYLTAFVLQGDSESSEVINTDNSWKAIKDNSYQPLPVRVPGYYVAGPSEFVDMNKHVSGWRQKDLDDSAWGSARAIGPSVTKDAAVNAMGWMLVPSPLPQMAMTVERLKSTRIAEGVQVPKGFPATPNKVTIPANSKATLLLDQGALTNGYPTIKFSGGKNASFAMGYAEALYTPMEGEQRGPFPRLSKDNRNEVEGKLFIGKTDSVVSNGKANQEYSPLWWRTYRYIKLKIYTGSEPLVIDDIYGTFTGYPFVKNSKLDVANAEMGQMVDIGWRTAQLCAFETYMDCPYYEQLQYIGDARIQALVTMYNTNDDRLVKQALTLMDHSRLAEGITLSRYPTDLDQQITTFSLWWVAMMHDYYRYGKDPSFIKGLLPGARQVMSFFERYQTADGSLKNLPYWLFTDWTTHDGWDFGMAPIGKNGESAVLDIQLAWVYQQAADLEAALGLKDLSQLYLSRAKQLKETIRKKYWVADKGLFADTETKDLFSQHANSLAILAGVVEGEEAITVAKGLMSDASLAPATIYFKFYLHQALTKAGYGNDYLSWLDKWRENINLGLTTWAETSEVATSRSDCHAWGSSPNVEFYRIILGIDSDGPGFSKVRIEPHLGTLTDISGEMPHPKGKLTVAYSIKKGALTADINLPGNTSGIFVWKGKEHELKGGANSLKL
ncbi:MAG: alpha-L-rhamnosidase C-terminal domain-containing protein [Imperialibacter sp.]|uniref:alpha-L-rhamnosidase-related protein n=1 Tax=Imperialibacter sp. TaxID=2038411 RepID=UPI0032EAA6B2